MARPAAVTMAGERAWYETGRGIMASGDELGSKHAKPGDCLCLTAGPRAPHYEERYLGTDKTNGRYADVELHRCRLCRRLWLRYQVEYEAFSRSGRWAEGIIDDATAATVTPEQAPRVLAKLPWHIYGGSWFGHAGRKGVGPIPDLMWDTVCEGPI